MNLIAKMATRRHYAHSVNYSGRSLCFASGSNGIWCSKSFAYGSLVIWWAQAQRR